MNNTLLCERCWKNDGIIVDSGEVLVTCSASESDEPVPAVLLEDIDQFSKCPHRARSYHTVSAGTAMLLRCLAEYANKNWKDSTEDPYWKRQDLDRIEDRMRPWFGLPARR